MSDSVDVSVLIPVRDGERYIAAAIESVLGGTCAPVEVIVIDDGSTDASGAAAAACSDRVRVVRQDARGIGVALNRGLAEARGELIAFVDADDLWTSGKLAWQLEALAEDPGLDAVFGLVEEFHSEDLPAEERAVLVLRPGSHPARVRGAMLARRGLFERVGPFDEALTVGEFVDWQSRAEAAGMRMRVLERVVLRRRLHARNLGRSAADARLDYVRVARAALRRKRAGARLES